MNNSFTVTLGSPPPGVSVNPVTGAISGTPTLAGNFSFVITGVDAVSGFSGSQRYFVVVDIGIRGITLPNAFKTQSYSDQLTPLGQTGSTTWSVTSGTLPPGLTLNTSTGLLSAVFVGVTLQPSALPSGNHGFAYNQQLTAVNAVGSTTWIVKSGSLPPGLALNASTGFLSGTI